MKKIKTIEFKNDILYLIDQGGFLLVMRYLNAGIIGK